MGKRDDQGLVLTRTIQPGSLAGPETDLWRLLYRGSFSRGSRPDGGGTHVHRLLAFSCVLEKRRRFFFFPICQGGRDYGTITVLGIG